MIHSYLRSVGFRNIKRSTDLYDMLEDVINHADAQYAQENPEGNIFLECRRLVGENIGISVCGDFTDDNKFHMEYYYPYMIGEGITTEEEVEIERHVQKESYAGICDDVRLGVTLIFYIQNSTEVLNERKKYGFFRSGRSVTIAGLAEYGKILLPIKKSQKQIKQMQEKDNRRIQMIADARDGDPAAIENLSLDEMDVYNKISQRIKKEDLFTIVESTFMPAGVESDQYTILGEILDCKKIENYITEEELWRLSLCCNHVVFDICINEKDLLGEPQPGRRFRGRVWLQGKVNYKDI